MAAILNEINGLDHSGKAPTVLTLLGLEPSALDAVRIEGTKPLPGIRMR